MIHLTNLSMAVSLLNQRVQSESAEAAREHVVATPASEPDPENAPVINLHHHNPGSPSEGIADSLSPVALNPQSLPPKEAFASVSDRFSAVAINPQPLPPREALEDLNRFSLAGRFG
jgi:hypothetical protein